MFLTVDFSCHESGFSKNQAHAMHVVMCSHFRRGQATEPKAV